MIEDDTYPAAEHRLPSDKLRVRVRPGFSRHELQGINVPVLESASIDEILGVRKTDFMTGSSDGLPAPSPRALPGPQCNRCFRSMSFCVTETKIEAKVEITNLTGHRFPSGVGFRRAFLEFQAIDTSEGRDRLFWASGRTDSLGFIVDDNGDRLQSELFEQDDDGEQSIEPHYERITSEGQAQIYQEITTNPEGEVTTSFFASQAGEGQSITPERLV